MYLIRMNNCDKFCDTAEEVKQINKSDILRVYLLCEVNYDDLISSGDIRDCVYKYLKKDQKEKDDVIDYVSQVLDVKKTDVSKVINKMKKEKIIYQVIDFDGWIGIE